MLNVFADILNTIYLTDGPYWDGEVDWEILGQEVTSHILDEVKRFENVDTKFGSGSKQPHDKTGWR